MPRIGPNVREVLCVVHVTVCARAARVLWGGGVGDVEEDEAGGAALILGQRAEGCNKVLLFVREDVVGAPERKAIMV